MEKIHLKSRPIVFWGLLALSIILLGLAIYFNYAFFLNKKNIEKNTYLSAKKQALYATQDMDNKLLLIMKITENTSNDLSDGSLNPENIPERLKLETQKDPSIEAMIVSFSPYGYKSANKLYSPYYFKNNQNNWELTYVEKSYDYTKPKLMPADPDTSWYLNTIHNNGPTWIEPFYGTVTKALISFFGVPFYYQNKGKTAAAQRGIVGTIISLNNIDFMVARLKLGKTGYAVVSSREDIIIAHPVKSEIGKKLSLPADYTGKNNKPYSFIDSFSGQSYWAFRTTLKSTGWRLDIMLNKADFQISPETKMREISLVLTLSILGLIILISALLKVDRGNIARLWLCSILTGILLLAGMIILWLSVFEIAEPQSGTTITSQAQLNRFIITQKKQSDPNLILIPTGIIVNSISFNTQETALISGFIWQRIPKNFPPEKIGFTLPQGVGYTATPILFEQDTDDQDKLVFFSFLSTFKQEFNPTYYPLDKENFAIQIWPKSLFENIFLVPDLASYKYINPKLLPGTKGKMNLKIWKMDKSFFSYEKNADAKSTVFSDRSLPFTFQFNISLYRAIVNSLINNLIPLFLISILLFAVLYTNSLPLIVSTSGGMLFFIALGHFATRSYIPIEGMGYLDYFYVFMYFLITLTTTLTILYYRKTFKILTFRDNIITKLLYWPFITAVGYLITLLMFGKLF